MQCKQRLGRISGIVPLLRPVDRACRGDHSPASAANLPWEGVSLEAWPGVVGCNLFPPRCVSAVDLGAAAARKSYPVRSGIRDNLHS